MKPDWAERLQRTFKRKYQAGWLDGYNVGYDRATEIQEQYRERIVAALKEKIKELEDR